MSDLVETSNRDFLDAAGCFISDLTSKTWTDCIEAEDYVVPYVLSSRDLVFRPDILDETVTSSTSTTEARDGAHIDYGNPYKSGSED